MLLFVTVIVYLYSDVLTPIDQKESNEVCLREKLSRDTIYVMFSKSVLDLREGKLLIPTWIDILDALLVHIKGDPISAIVSLVYIDFANYQNSMYIFWHLQII
jgi:hypothetical protein